MKWLSLTAVVLATSIHAVPVDQWTFAASEGALAGRLMRSMESKLSPDHFEQLREHVLSLPEQRSIEMASGAVVTMTEGEKALLTASDIKFVDVTDRTAWFTSLDAAKKDPLPKELRFNSSELSSYFDDIDTVEMKRFLTKFTSFRTRYYRSETGKQSQQFLLSTIKSIIEKAKGVSVREFTHSWGQNSLIVRFEPKGDDKGHWKMNKGQEPSIFVLGAHQDSTNLLPFLGAPGADDDGSGTTSQLAALTALVKNGFRPTKRALEFHFYSAEEGGMLGSGAVAQDYMRQGKHVSAMIQADMTAWWKRGTKQTIGIVTDFVDPTFTSFVRKTIDEYAEIGWVDTKCGYKCSDHASWSDVGVPSAFTIEAAFEDTSHNIHSGNDRIDYSDEFSFEHMAQFSRLMTALAVELTA